LHGRRIERLGGGRADEVVDRRGNAGRGGEVGVAQRQPHVGQAIERELDLPLDDAAVGDAADRGYPAHDFGGFALELESGDRDRALRDRVDVAVRTEQRRDQERPALEALGVTERRYGHVDRGALGGEGGQVRRHHHGRDVAGVDSQPADVDAEALEHRLQRLFGERDVVEEVAGLVEPDHEAVADELVLAHALDVGEVLDARGRAGRQAGRRQHRGRRDRGKAAPQRADHRLLPAAAIRAPQRSPKQHLCQCELRASRSGGVSI
jgi:hypothetical protein